MTLANQRVQVAHPTRGNNRAKGVVGTAYPAVGDMDVMFMYLLAPEDPEDLGKVEDLLFTEAELESLA